MRVAIQSVQPLPSGRVQISGRRHVPSWQQKLWDQTYQPGVIQLGTITISVDAKGHQVAAGMVAGLYSMVDLLVGHGDVDLRSAGKWVVAAEHGDLEFDSILPAIEALDEVGGQLFLTKPDGRLQSVHDALSALPGVLVADNGKYLILARN